MKTWTTTVLTGLVALLLTSVTPASAQPAVINNFINASVGVQMSSRTEEAALTFPLYQELAIFEQEIEPGNGPFFDASFARHTGWHNLILGGGLSYFGRKGDAEGTASIPDPHFFNRPALIPIAGEDLLRTELGFHFLAVFLLPINETMDVAISAGPSIFSVRQEFLSGTVAPDTQDLTPAIEEQSAIGVGLNIGADLTYLFTPHAGIGVLIRYTWARVDLDAGSMTAGGFQIGAGIRFRM